LIVIQINVKIYTVTASLVIAKINESQKKLIIYNELEAFVGKFNKGRSFLRSAGDPFIWGKATSVAG
jgi:hypothetical protein